MSEIQLDGQHTHPEIWMVLAQIKEQLDAVVARIDLMSGSNQEAANAPEMQEEAPASDR